MRGGAALVGERGPELVNLPQRRPGVPPGRQRGRRDDQLQRPNLRVDDFDEAVNKARLRFRRAGN